MLRNMEQLDPATRRGWVCAFYLDQTLQTYVRSFVVALIAVTIDFSPSVRKYQYYRALRRVSPDVRERKRERETENGGETVKNEEAPDRSI